MRVNYTAMTISRKPITKVTSWNCNWRLKVMHQSYFVWMKFWDICGP